MSTLAIVSAGPCSGHPCDQCSTCAGSVPKRVRGDSPGREPRCCRRDNPDYQLPAEGEWDGPVYGQIGRLDREYESVECHACGGRFRRMHTHVWQAHNLTAREYKAIFGLKLRESLDCGENQERNRRGHAFLSDPNDPRTQKMAEVRAQNAFTPERATYVQGRQRVSTQEMRERRETGTVIGVGARRKPDPCVVCGGAVAWTPHHRRTCSESCRKTWNYRNHGSALKGDTSGDGDEATDR